MSPRSESAERAGGPRPAVVDVDGRPVRLSNLSKVLYPESGFTKGMLLDYYAKVAPMMLPHLAGRPATFIRYPDGVGGEGFFAKHATKATPEWVRTTAVTSTRSGKTIEYVVVDDLATLMWAANQAAVEIHVPQWRVAAHGRPEQPEPPEQPDLLVLDLDPGAPADILDCARLALLAHDVLAAHGLEARAKTSGSKGLHVYAPLAGATSDQAKELAHAIATLLEKRHPGLAVSRMAKAERGGKVFIDWSQNSRAKTTAAPYSLRATSVPHVSTPVTWDEVADAGDARDLSFTPEQVIARVAAHGDLFSALGCATLQ